MKVVCINNEFAEEFLTIGKEYEVVYHMENQYAVNCDTGAVLCHAKNNFKADNE